MRSRLSSSRSFVFHRSGLRRWRRLLCPLLTSPRYSAAVASGPASMFRSTGEISQGKTHYLHCIDAGFTKCTLLPQMEDFAVTCPLVPNASRLISGFCSSPRSFGLGFLQTPPRGDALALLLAFGSAIPGHRTFTDEVKRHAWRTRAGNRRCAALSRSVQRPKGARSDGSPVGAMACAPASWVDTREVTGVPTSRRRTAKMHATCCRMLQAVTSSWPSPIANGASGIEAWKHTA